MRCDREEQAPEVVRLELLRAARAHARRAEEALARQDAGRALGAWLTAWRVLCDTEAR